MYHLDLTELNNVLCLPCYIDDIINLVDSAIISEVTYHGCYYTHKILKGETLNIFLSRIYDKVPYNMDCFVYVQLISYIFKMKWPKDGGEINIYYPRWLTKIDEAKYICASNKKVFKFIQSLDNG